MRRSRILGFALLGLAAATAWWLLRPGEPMDPAPSPAAPPPERTALPEAPSVPRAAPAADPAPRAVSPAPPPAAYEPTAEDMQVLLRSALDLHWPDRKLSSDEIAQAADALLRLRRAREELRELEPSPENAARLRSLRQELGRAVDDFQYVLEMSPAEFTARAQPGIGIDRDPGDAPVPDPAEPVYLRDLPSRE